MAGRRRLKAVLRRTREDLRLTQQRVAEAMEWSLSKLIRIESGAVGVSATDLKALLSFYSITDSQTVNGLTALARAGRRRPWWTEYRDPQLDSPGFVTLIGLETDATSLKIFNTVMLPGLLQCESYARAALRTLIPSPTPEQLDVKVEVRLRRQREVLDRDEPPAVHVVLDEAVLRRMPKDPVTAREQLHHLLALTERPNISVQIVPFSVGVYHLASPFFILSFSEPDDPDVVYLESTLTEEMIEDQRQVGYYDRAFEAIRAKTHDQAKSIRLINDAAERLAQRS